MSWKSDKAIERLVKTFQRVKNQIFEQDVEAIKTINETIETNEKQYVTDNILFAKLLCHFLNLNLHHHGNMKIAIKEADNVFKMSLREHIEIITKNLNDQDVINFLKGLGADMESFSNQPELLSKNEKEIIERLQTNWELTKVSKSFYNTANEFLRDTNNYV